MTEENFTSRKLNWVGGVLHDRMVPPWAFEVAYCIISHLNAGSGRAFVSDETVSDETGISVRTVRRARCLLRNAGWLRWKRTSTANVYLNRDPALAESAIRKLEMGYAQRAAAIKTGTDSSK